VNIITSDQIKTGIEDHGLKDSVFQIVQGPKRLLRIKILSRGKKAAVECPSVFESGIIRIVEARWFLLNSMPFRKGCSYS
jgi:hypothetical protein